VPFEIAANTEFRREPLRQQILRAHGRLEMVQSVFSHEEHVGKKHKGAHARNNRSLRLPVERGQKDRKSLFIVTRQVPS